MTKWENPLPHEEDFCLHTQNPQKARHITHQHSQCPYRDVGRGDRGIPPLSSAITSCTQEWTRKGQYFWQERLTLKVVFWSPNTHLGMGKPTLTCIGMHTHTPHTYMHIICKFIVHICIYKVEQTDTPTLWL